MLSYRSTGAHMARDYLRPDGRRGSRPHRMDLLSGIGLMVWTVQLLGAEEEASELLSETLSWMWGNCKTKGAAHQGHEACQPSQSDGSGCPMEALPASVIFSMHFRLVAAAVTPVAPSTGHLPLAGELGALNRYPHARNRVIIPLA